MIFHHNLPFHLLLTAHFITAWSNDVGFDSLFSRQVEGIGESEDVLVALSTSGNSENVVQAVETAKSMGVKVIILSGKSAGKLDSTGDVNICVPSNDTQHIQEGHITAGHIFCEMVEQAFE